MSKSTKKVTSELKKESDNILSDLNITSALSYFPYLIGALAMYFLAEDKKTLHHVKYSAMMAVAVIVLMFILNGIASVILNFAYWGVSLFFAFKAYKGEEVKVEIFDTIEEKISEKIKR
jgi:uncharacterized membrane protein